MIVAELNTPRATDTLRTLIGERVIEALGRPAGLLRVKVCPLWLNFYRVNVLIGADVGSATVANSYFVEADADGNIVRATPNVARRY
jgi:hypothetical protein